ncbi:hypothetical protein M3223_09890 [Paenibacillus pasadenensis]|uniref:hypothetical protein n=1 Tax=Paenibacillus pasadenensis TaxID=217090 RepID=UPI0020407A22|nr:hypothetical protein [Paenibacillus pasadenensis]MCM3747668.1 hypothetical protein [Paenibacillus pasadenensis]
MNYSYAKTKKPNLWLGVRLVLLILLLIAIKLIKKRKKCGCPPVIGTTQGFEVENNTKSITLTLTTAGGSLENPPPPLNTPFPPGNKADFEVTTRAAHTTRGYIGYTGTAADGTPITVTFTLVNYGGVFTGVDDLKSTGPVNVNATTTTDAADLVTIADS